MAEITLRFDELESGELPPVCMQCGRKRDVELVPRRFVWTPMFAPPMMRMMMTKRVSADIPLCPAHGGSRLFAYGSSRLGWQPLRTVAIGADRITIDRVHEEFADALYRRRKNGERDDWDRPRPRAGRVQVGRGPGGGGAALKGLVILAAVMIGFVVVGVVGMFGLMAVGVLFLPKAAPPPTTATPVSRVIVQPGPEGVVVGLLGPAPQAEGLGAAPWAALALCGQNTTFHLLDDAELDKALAALRDRNPGAVADAAHRLAHAAPTEGRRQETAQALVAALADNPFPTAKQAAAEALGKWGTKDDVPGLIEMLGVNDPNTRAAAMAALAGLKDERGAAAMAERLSNLQDRGKARQALEAMGPAAETAVAPMVNRGDVMTRIEACGVLKAIGTKESLPELEIASHDGNQVVARAAADAVAAIQKRP